MKNEFIFYQKQKTNPVHTSCASQLRHLAVYICIRLHGVQMAACVQILLLPASRLLGQMVPAHTYVKYVKPPTCLLHYNHVHQCFFPHSCLCLRHHKNNCFVLTFDIFLWRSCQGHIYTYLTWRTPSSRANYIYPSSLRVKGLAQGPNNGNLVVGFELTTFWSIFILTS